MTRERIYCNSCKGETWHESVAHYNHERYDDLWGHSQTLDSEILKCCGCEAITFRLVKHPFEFQDEKDSPEVILYPDRTSKIRKRKFYPHLPKHIHQLYQETVIAHNTELIVLSTVGIRSLVEAIVADKIDPSKYANNLESKIEALRSQFRESVIGTLHEFRKIGNKAAHELQAPEKLNIHHALYVVEGILEFFYGIEGYAKLFRDHHRKP